MPRLKTLVVIRRIVHRSSARIAKVSFRSSPLQPVQHSPIIPKRTRPRRPVEPHLDINITLIHLEQILQNRIALASIQPNDPHRHRAVHEETLPACHRMYSDERMASLDVLGPCVWVVAVEVGVRGAVDGVFAVNDLAEVRGQLLVGGVARGPEGVAADGGDCVVVQVGYAGWLALVGAGCWCQLGLVSDMVCS
jgi:hypothetical protein